MSAKNGMDQLNHLWQPGCDFLGCRYAILGGAMTWLSERHLVAAISHAGGFGVLACGSMEPDTLATEIKATRDLTSQPFGVNLILMHPQLEELIDLCIHHSVSHVVLAGGIPKKIHIERLKQGGSRVLAFAPTLGLARKLLRSGCDALIIEGMEAGGHIGPVSTSVLAQEILPEIRDVPVFVAGGIGHGAAMLSYLEMGAAGCQLGTRFVCATECVAHPNFKNAFLRAAARDAEPSLQRDPRFPVIPVRALKNQASQRFVEFQGDVIDRHDRGELNQTEAQLQIEKFWAGALRQGAINGDIEKGSLMAGQSVGMVKQEQTVHAIIEELTTQATIALESRNQNPATTALKHKTA